MQRCGVLLARQQPWGLLSSAHHQPGCVADTQPSTAAACMAWQRLSRQLTQHLKTHKGPQQTEETDSSGAHLWPHPVGIHQLPVKTADEEGALRSTLDVDAQAHAGQLCALQAKQRHSKRGAPLNLLVLTLPAQQPRAVLLLSQVSRSAHARPRQDLILPSMHSSQRHCGCSPGCAELRMHLG